MNIFDAACAIPAAGAWAQCSHGLIHQEARAMHAVRKITLRGAADAVICQGDADCEPHMVVAADSPETLKALGTSFTLGELTIDQVGAGGGLVVRRRSGSIFMSGSGRGITMIGGGQCAPVIINNGSAFVGSYAPGCCRHRGAEYRAGLPQRHWRCFGVRR